MGSELYRIAGGFRQAIEKAVAHNELGAIFINFPKRKSCDCFHGDMTLLLFVNESDPLDFLPILWYNWHQ